MVEDRKTFLAGLKSLLRYHKVIGIDHYPLNKDVQSFLQSVPSPGKEGQATVAPPPQSVRRPSGNTARNVPAVHRSPVNLSDIVEEISSCHACDLHKQRLYPVAGRGPEKVRLMIVGDWLSSDEQGVLPPGHLFGFEQDQMLARMLAAINLPLAEVFISNVIKCAIPAACQPQAAHVQSCVSFLRRQIEVVTPEVICAMGMVAARVILEKSQPLSRLRGRVHEYETATGGRIPVIATYHPSYLLQNPEMKGATWADLQFLARHLGLKTV